MVFAATGDPGSITIRSPVFGGYRSVGEVDPFVALSVREVSTALMSLAFAEGAKTANDEQSVTDLDPYQLLG